MGQAIEQFIEYWKDASGGEWAQSQSFLNDLLAFLTCEPNKEVAAVHPKAMPVILTTPAEIETWLTAPTAEAVKLQWSLPNGALQVVARGKKSDD